MREHYCSLRV